MRYIIEVLDARDSKSDEPWSLFDAFEGEFEDAVDRLDEIFNELQDAIEEHEILEVRMKITR